MKLLFKTSIYFFISSLIVFLIGSIIFYFLVTHELNSEIDEVLYFKKEKIIEHIKKEGTLPVFSNMYDVKVIISSASVRDNKSTLKDTLLFNELKGENISFRVLSFTCKMNNLIYKIQLLKSVFELEDLIKGILTFILVLLLILLFSLFIVNIFISQKVLKPFYLILRKLQNFDITKNNSLEMGNPKTYEFIQLKNELLSMTEKARVDYVQQKEFIENASHEIQTPLAVIKMKCELLLQSDNNSEKQIKSITAINESASRLSKLNQALLLITKIENKQFQANQNIDIQKYLEKNIINFEELISLKNIKLSTDFRQSPILSINPTLVDIMISNLINNAIRHNVENGNIYIIMTFQELIFRNTGEPLSINPDDLFKRFFKDKSKKDSLGLGLTIVKKITDFYNMNITYYYENNLHNVKIEFGESILKT